MSIPKRERTANIREALRVMLEMAGDGCLDGALFDAGDAGFAHILPTTWEELETTQCVERVQWDYRLTAHGWIMALEAAGRLCDEKMKRDLGEICKPMKRRCETGERRHMDGTTIQELAQETGFSENWIYNVVESHLIRICLQRVDCEWEPDDQNKNYVMIPARFGLPL